MSEAFKPTEKQRAYIQEATARWNFKTGAVRCGKTFLDINYTIPYRIRERSNKPGLSVIIGVTKETVERNILEPMRTRFGKALVGEIDNRNRCRLFGERVYCLGAEKASQVSKIQGACFKYVYGDEVARWAPEVFQMLKSRLDQPYSCFDGALNPEHPEHYLKKFMDSDVDIYVQHYTIDDNPTLDQKFVYNLKKEYAGTVYYDRYILGLWTKAEGLVYPMFDHNIHVVPSISRNYTSYQISMDYGIFNATSMGLWGYFDGVWYRVKEYFHSGRDEREQKTDIEYYEELIKLATYHEIINGKKVTREYPIQRVVIDPSAASFITLIRKKGKFRVLKANNAVLDGIRNTATALSKELIKINDCCENAIREFGLYSWDGKKQEDSPLKENDHVMDDTRYFVQTNNIVMPKRKSLLKGGG